VSIVSDKERPEQSKPFNEDLEIRNFGLLDLHAVGEELPPVEIQDNPEAEPSPEPPR